MLGIAVVLEGFSLRTAVREAAPGRRGRSWWGFIKHTKNPELPVVLLEDTGALIGLAFALSGIGLAAWTGDARWDAAGSLAIGVLLVVIAYVLSVETKSLLIGEAAAPEVQASIRDMLMAEGGKIGPVRAINEIRTMQLGPHDVIVAASVDMADDATARDVEAANARLDQAIKARHPEVKYLFIEVEAAKAGSTAPGPAPKAVGDVPAAPTPPTPKPVISARPPTARKVKGKKHRH